MDTSGLTDVLTLWISVKKDIFQTLAITLEIT